MVWPFKVSGEVVLSKRFLLILNFVIVPFWFILGIISIFVEIDPYMKFLAPAFLSSFAYIALYWTGLLFWILKKLGVKLK